MKPAKPRGRPLSYTAEELLDRLVQAVTDLLAEQGADADISVARIAARAKVSKKTVYTAIESKEELIGHVIRRGAQLITGILDSPVNSGEAARALLACFLSQWAQHACGPTAVGIFVMAICERSRYPAIGAAYHAARHAYGFQKLADWLACMDAAGWLAVPDPDLRAEFLITLAASERQRQLALGLAAPLDDAQHAQRIAAILALLMPPQRL
jgi:AcrR family transcriptional regulator